MKLVLLSPLLTLPTGTGGLRDIPTIIVHGSRDTTLPVAVVKRLAESVFSKLDFRVVDDVHGLSSTFQSIGSKEIIRP
jgi:predicted esterase